MSPGRLPRILEAVHQGAGSDLSSHLKLNGPLLDPGRVAAAQLLDEVQRSGLRGRGGAAFPVTRKMQAVVSRRGPAIVLGNGAEGEPASGKDRLLLAELPHLVLDGIAVAAHAVGAEDAILAYPADDPLIGDGLAAAVDERRGLGIDADPNLELVAVDDGFVTGNESALVSAVSGGDGKPTFGPRPYERGVRRRPTLVQNAETLAHLALIARHGAAWFRELGTEPDPGSALLTLSGAISAPGVYEIEHGVPLAEVLDRAQVTEDLSAVLIGGYFGSWVPARLISRLRLSPAELAGDGAALGAGVIIAFGRSACPVAEMARVADYLASESSGQCGPCVHGLDAIAHTLAEVATGTASPAAGRDLDRWTTTLAGRGACQFPDGVTRLVASALRLFADEFEDHRRHGRCERCSRPPVLPVTAAGIR
jgi:NADH:ubiquinone oxidoreductase subunit F (NADH-binding)